MSKNSPNLALLVEEVVGEIPFREPDESLADLLTEDEISSILSRASQRYGEGTVAVYERQLHDVNYWPRTAPKSKESHWAQVFSMNKSLMGMALLVALVLATLFVLGSLFT